FGQWGLAVIGLVIASFIGAKAWQRHRFNVKLRMARLTVESLAELLDRGEQPLIVDVRSNTSSDDGRIPGAIVSLGDDLGPELLAHPKESLVVVYCACPNDASAVLAARRLLERGFLDVRPLAGGIDAWTATGRSLQS
ncbi:MAG: sulfurtransferase, partial [Rhizobiales bacterium]|nr:sulfurtransferase [Rhizobacter sp.]